MIMNFAWIRILKAAVAAPTQNLAATTKIINFQHTKKESCSFVFYHSLTHRCCQFLDKNIIQILKSRIIVTMQISIELKTSGVLCV